METCIKKKNVWNVFFSGCNVVSKETSISGKESWKCEKSLFKVMGIPPCFSVILQREI